MRRGAESGLPPLVVDDFTAWLKDGQVDQKRTDALVVLAAIRAHLAAGVTPLAVSYRFHDTGYHQAAMWSTQKFSP